MTRFVPLLGILTILLTAFLLSKSRRAISWRIVGWVQAADIYQVQAFRGHEKQYMRLASAWSVVFLLAIATSYFTKSGDQFSRVWLGSFYVVGLVALIGFRRALFLQVRRWTRQGSPRPPHRRGGRG